MQPLKDYIAGCLASKSLVRTPSPDLFWTPSVERKLQSPVANRGIAVTLQYPDFIVGTYDSLAKLKRKVQSEGKHLLKYTEIHHVVERYHLEFPGLLGALTENTYRYREPCVLLSDAHHEKYLEALIGGAEKLVLETRGFDFVRLCRDANRGISQLSRTHQAIVRARWVNGLPSHTDNRVSRRELRAWIAEIYDFAYQQHDESVLRSIAAAVIFSFPV